MRQDTLKGPGGPCHALSDCLRSDGGQIAFAVPDGVLPGFLIDAFNATLQGDLGQAAQLIGPQNQALVDRMMVEQWPGALLASVIMATVLQRVGQLEAAIQRYEAIVRLEPHALVLNELGTIYQAMGLPSRALVYQQRALQINPQDDALQANCALGLIKAGRVQEGVKLLETLVASGRATASAHSSLLLLLHYLPQTDPQRPLAWSKQWGRAHAPQALARRTHANGVPTEIGGCPRLGRVSGHCERRLIGGCPRLGGRPVASAQYGESSTVQAEG